MLVNSILTLLQVNFFFNDRYLLDIYQIFIRYQKNQIFFSESHHDVFSQFMQCFVIQNISQALKIYSSSIRLQLKGQHYQVRKVFTRGCALYVTWWLLIQNKSITRSDLQVYNFVMTGPQLHLIQLLKSITKLDLSAIKAFCLGLFTKYLFSQKNFRPHRSYESYYLCHNISLLHIRY